MGRLDVLLERLGVKYEDLNAAEKETLLTWLGALKKNKVTVNSIKTYINRMKTAVEQKLTTTKHNSKQDLFLKARLKNYLLLEAFLTSPEKAREALEKALSGVLPKV